MKNVKLKGVIIILAMTILFSACNKAGAQTGSGRSINSADDLKKYLDSQPANSRDKPIKVAMKVNEQMIYNIVSVIYDAGKFVSLDLTGSPLSTIPEEAFKGLTSLTNIVIPDSVTSIEGDAFYNCTSLTGITIGKGVISMGDRVFTGCTSLTSINVNASNNVFSAQNGVLYNKDKTNLCAYPSVKGSYTILDSVIDISSYAFNGCTGLTNVIIPSSVTWIGDYAFTGCTSLTNVSIGNGVEGIGLWAFANCSSLTSVTIPDSVTYLGPFSFGSCTSLTNVTIGNGITMIILAFSKCTNLTSVTFSTGSNIPSDGIHSDDFPYGYGLMTAYFAASSKAGTYKRALNENWWTKQ